MGNACRKMLHMWNASPPVSHMKMFPYANAAHMALFIFNTFLLSHVEFLSTSFACFYIISFQYIKYLRMFQQVKRMFFKLYILIKTILTVLFVACEMCANICMLIGCVFDSSFAHNLLKHL